MPSLRLPKPARLTRASEFRKVKETGKSYPGRCMVLGVLATSTAEPPRVGIITSRRIGSAVIRNRVRRRLREAVRMDRPMCVGGRWLVLVARQRAATAKFDDLQREWRKLATAAGVLITDA